MEQEPINSNKKKYKRLLEDFPVSELKEWSGLPGKKEEIAEAISADYSEQAIKDFVADKFGKLHQTVYVFEKNQEFDFGKLINSEEIYSSREMGVLTKIFVKDVAIPYFDTKDFAMKDLLNLIPFKVSIGSNYIAIFIKIHRSDITKLFQYKVYRDSNVNVDRELLEKMNSCVSVELQSQDLNKGVKYMWNLDEYDSVDVRHTGDLASRRATMHEDFKFKRDCPKEYESIRHTPLNKLEFEYGGEGDLVKRFQCDASRGLLKINRHSVGEDDASTIINLILNNNV